MSWFGFDFNDDGNVSFGEHMFTMDMLGFFDDEKKQGSSSNDFDEDFDELDELDLEESREKLRDSLDAMESSKSDLEDALFNLEMHEPDILSPAYDSWVAHRDALQEQIDQMDGDIIDLEDSLSELDTW